MLLHEHRVHFHEVDAAGFVFFPHFWTWAHEAMEKLFEPLDGGYRALIVDRRVGLPAVHLEADFRVPLRYGDVARIEARVVRVGQRSLTLGYRVRRGADDVVAAELRHTVVSTDLGRAESCAMPDDVRRVAEAHLDRPSLLA